MPTYDYRCPNGHDFEHFFRKISDATAELVCPTCGAVAQRRVSGGAGLVFKGSGFYLTDYGKNAHRKGSEGGGGSSESKSESSTESKSSSKTESAKPEGSASGAKSEGSTKSEASKSSQSKTSSPKPTGGDSK
jgi:putative FmdB family regulatory protein